MSISRIDKLVFENLNDVDSLGASASRRASPFQIIIAAEEPKKFSLMAHMAVSLALRSFSGPIYVHLGNSAGLGIYPGIFGLQAELEEVERRFLGERKRLQFKSSGVLPDLPTIRIGGGDGPGITVDAAGWVAGINTHFDARVEAEAPVAAFAVGCAFSRVFNSSVLARELDMSAWCFDLLGMATASSPPRRHTLEHVQLGRIGLLGAGAIGSAFSYILQLSGWSAELDVIDYDFYEEPNHETTFLVGMGDVLNRPNKAEHLSTAISDGSRLTTRPYKIRIEANSAELALRRDAFVCAVDNPETRRILDAVNSTLLLNSGVGGSKLDSGHVLFTRHKRSDRALSEIYKELAAAPSAANGSVPKEFADECSRIRYENVSLAAPFIALVSGALLLAGCAQELLDIEPGIDYLKLDLFGIQSSMDRRLLTRRS